ncbi:hypothetical protein HaLaN_20550 [Haematococcus lacustris]|uniref:Uncharacterized protein n=1 Tax=Haematococcus lacustris TaxID=44745 RepID=A0A699ZLT9_HAELA|nr:hypothetical protein HaLaN_20550 [Haematococcus lacustris]
MQHKVSQCKRNAAKQTGPKPSQAQQAKKARALGLGGDHGRSTAACHQPTDLTCQGPAAHHTAGRADHAPKQAPAAAGLSHRKVLQRGTRQQVHCCCSSPADTASSAFCSHNLIAK